MNLSNAIAFTLGILAILAQRQLPEASWLAVAAIPALVPWRWRSVYASALLGVLLTVWRSQALLDQRWPEARYGEEVWIQGHIASMNRLQPPKLLVSLVMLQLMPSLVLAPLTVGYFHGVLWFAPVLNLFAVLLFSPITPVLLFAILMAALTSAWGVLWCAQALTWLHDGLAWLATNLP